MITGKEPQMFSKQQAYGKQTNRKYNSDEVRGDRQVKRLRKQRLQEVRQRELMGNDE